MPFMPACSVHKACSAAGGSLAGATPGLCSPFSQLATVCRYDVGMGGMSGCHTYTSLCAKGSLVSKASDVVCLLPKCIRVVLRCVFGCSALLPRADPTHLQHSQLTRMQQIRSHTVSATLCNPPCFVSQVAMCYESPGLLLLPTTHRAAAQVCGLAVCFLTSHTRKLQGRTYLPKRQ